MFDQVGLTGDIQRGIQTSTESDGAGIKAHVYSLPSRSVTAAKLLEFFGAGTSVAQPLLALAPHSSTLDLSLHYDSALQSYLELTCRGGHGRADEPLVQEK